MPAAQKAAAAPQTLETVLDEIEVAVREYEEAERSEIERRFRRTLAHVRLLKRLRDIISLSFVETELMTLMNTRVGFMTDRGPHARKPDDRLPYTAAELVEPILEALVWGANLHGGEFMVLRNRAYLCKPYYIRKLEEVASEIEFTPGPCEMRGDKVLVPARLTCKSAKGEVVAVERWNSPNGRDERVQLPAFASDGIDKWIGLAEKRIYQEALRRITGRRPPTVDIEPEDLGQRIEHSARRGHAVIAPEEIAAGKEPNRGHGQELLRTPESTVPASAPPEAATPAVLKRVDAPGEYLGQGLMMHVDDPSQHQGETWWRFTLADAEDAKARMDVWSLIDVSRYKGQHVRCRLEYRKAGPKRMWKLLAIEG